jgi:hypothetical protein
VARAARTAPIAAPIPVPGIAEARRIAARLAA